MTAQKPRRTRFTLTAASLALAATATVHAQCNPQWYPTAGVAGGAGFNVGALTTWDPDGPGPLAPVLVIGGSFTSAGGVPASNIATWNGSAYAPIGVGITGEVDALAVLPDGRLVAAGLISEAGGAPVTNVAVWNGAAWGPLGAGLNGQVWTLSTSATGELFAGGVFTASGAVTTNHVARWNGASWAPAGTGSANGVGGIVYAITPLANGDMVVGGAFTAAGGVTNRRRVARWGADGLWYAMGGGMDNTVLSLGTLSDGNVVAGGIFTYPGSRVAQWNGSAWVNMGPGTNAQPLAFLPRPGGHLIAGGHFFFAGTVAASKVAYWDGSAWSAMGIGMDQYVIALAAMPSGDVFAGGGFSTVDGQPSPCLARWSAPAPAITAQPANKSSCTTSGAQFSIAASGPALTYHWQVESPANSGLFTDLSALPGSTFVEPASGLTFEFTGAATTTLGLSSITLGTHPAEIRLTAVVSNSCGTVTSDPATLAVCYANCDCSTAAPILNVNDFVCFQQKFAAADPYANCDGSTAPPILNVNDFTCFLNHFASGCP